MTRYENNIFIKLTLPASVIENVVVYRTELFDLPVPGKQGLITSLTNISPYFVFSEQTALVGELKTAPNHYLIRNSDIVWNRHYENDCLQDIISDYATSVHSVCDYTVRKA